MNRTLIVYASKYGSTSTAVQKLALILGPATAITPADFNEKHRDFNTVVIGSPVYGELILDEIKEFIQTNSSWLKTKKVALFTLSLSPTGVNAFSHLRELLGDCVVWLGGFGGIYDPSLLDESDSQAMEQFSKITGFDNRYVNLTDEAIFADKAIEMKRVLKNTLSMPKDKLVNYLDNFLLVHNTCTLCTGNGYEVRATPIEYSYFDKALYFLSEGGEKFAHILVNPNVSVAVYDDYTGFQNLGGLQISGKAEIVFNESEEYVNVISKKGLDAAKLKNLPSALNMIKVNITSYELLSSEIGRDGYDAKQTLIFI